MSAKRNTDEFESLIGQEARIRRPSRMIPSQGPLNDRLREEVLSALVAYMREAELSQADVARAIGQSTTYINNVLSSSDKVPTETRDQILRDVNNWLDREARARENRRPARFVETRVARRLIDAAERLTERADMASARGPAGIGKTMTARAIEAELNAVYVMVDDDCRSPSGLRHKIYNALSRRKRTTTVSFAQLVDGLRMPPRVNTCNLLIVDEAQDLFPNAFTTLRKLHEQAHCSILFLGTVDLETCLSTDDDPEFGQISSRVGIRINLARELSGATRGGKPAERLFSIQDIRALFSQGKLKLHPSTARMLATIANTTRGALRRVDRLYFWAQKAALKRRAAQILPEHVEIAAAIVGEELGISAADVLGHAGQAGPPPSPSDDRAEATA
jgi:DNA transposition AAA+ family ATPase